VIGRPVPRRTVRQRCPASRHLTPAELAGAAAGGAVGAVVRYAMTSVWPSPHQVLFTTALTAAVAFAVAGAVLAATVSRLVHVTVLSICGAAASLSAFAVTTVGQTLWLAASFLVLTPLSALLGLMAGLRLGRALAP
jgi:CrcB protein